MNDIHKKLAKRSMKDAAYLQEDVAEEYGIEFPDQMVGQFAMALYQHRVQSHRQKTMEAKQKAANQEMDPESGDMGRY